MLAVKTIWSSSSRALLGWLYPPQCCLCARVGHAAICQECESEMMPLEPGEEPAASDELAFRVSAFSYEGRASQAVRRLKFSRSTALAPFMAAHIYRVASERGLVDGRVVVPVPIHWARRCFRGFNQSDLLCEDFPPEARGRLALIRVRATRPQVGLSGVERQTNLAGAFAAAGDVRGLKVLLVDDVITTGHTARECARALLQAGAKEVGVICFAGSREEDV